MSEFTTFCSQDTWFKSFYISEYFLCVETQFLHFWTLCISQVIQNTFWLDTPLLQTSLSVSLQALDFLTEIYSTWDYHFFHLFVYQIEHKSKYKSH